MHPDEVGRICLAAIAKEDGLCAENRHPAVADQAAGWQMVVRQCLVFLATSICSGERDQVQTAAQMSASRSHSDQASLALGCSCAAGRC